MKVRSLVAFLHFNPLTLVIFVSKCVGGHIKTDEEFGILHLYCFMNTCVFD